MKLTLLQRCLCASLFFHSAVLGAAALAGLTAHRAVSRPEADTITLTLIAAPLMSPDPAPRQPEIIAPALPAAEAPKPIETEPVEPPVPVTPVAEPLLRPPPQPIEPASAPVETASVAPPVSNARTQGDGSSARPGLDPTTAFGQPGVKARPNYLNNPEPPYPALARRRGQEGLVMLTVKVTAGGRAATVALKGSSGFSLLDAAALQAVRDWEFEPARIGSRAVEAEIEVPVRFRLSR